MALAKRNQILIGAILVVLLSLLALWMLRSEPGSYLDTFQEDWTPQDALTHYIESMEEGDLPAVADMTMDKDRDELLRQTEGHTREDLIAAGLDIRQEEYRLEEAAADKALFYSPRSGLYLAMTREDGIWKIDVSKTDDLNGEKELAAPSPSPATPPPPP